MLVTKHWFIVRRDVAVAVLVAATVIGLSAMQRPVERNEDATKTPGACRLYNTHHHADSSRSYQLTCSAPVPESVTVYPLRTR